MSQVNYWSSYSTTKALFTLRLLFKPTTVVSTSNLEAKTRNPPRVPSLISESPTPNFFSMQIRKSSRNPKKRSIFSATQDEEKEEHEQIPMKDIEDLFSEEETHKIRESMLIWYDKNKRDLPWRREVEEGGRERRAYEVWVSEVMLQQTRVQAVIDYYNRWMTKWPTIHHLAKASLEEVNEMWAGLGYYRRGRFLLEGAKMIVAGEDDFPNSASTLRKIKGIGDYTAGAIASIAFKEVVPVVDGNVVRVLARLKAISANPKDRDTIKNFWKLSGQLVDPSRPGDFNQSVMELGATVCTPLNPDCSSCPVVNQCRAYAVAEKDRSITVTDYPTKVVKPKQRHDFSYVCVVEILQSKGNYSDSQFLLKKRPEDGLLAGLWEFPCVTLDKDSDLTMRRKEIDLYLKKTFKLDVEETCRCSIVSREYVGEFIHIFTHIRRKIYVELLILHLKDGVSELSREQHKEAVPWKCMGGNALLTTGLTTAVRKVYTMIQKFKKKEVSPTTVPSRNKISLKKLKST